MDIHHSHHRAGVEPSSILARPPSSPVSPIAKWEELMFAINYTRRQGRIQKTRRRLDHDFYSPKGIISVTPLKPTTTTTKTTAKGAMARMRKDDDCDTKTEPNNNNSLLASKWKEVVKARKLLDPKYYDNAVDVARMPCTRTSSSH
eukprot:scaffold479_cov97-Cylindrotheca_fusiformis.AAC.10